MKTLLASLIFTIVLFSGCSLSEQPQVKKLFQTNNATTTHDNYKNSLIQLLQYHKKLNLRNPTKYNPKTVRIIHNEIKYSNNNYFLFGTQTRQMRHYKDYLNLAFSKDDVRYRSDYLILGMYKLLYDTYSMHTSHKFTSLSYDFQKFHHAHKLMQVIQWKIKNDKDKYNNYLFKTWQNNWQLELEKKIKQGVEPSWELIQKLKFIQNKQESIFDPSNNSFELLSNNIIQNLKRDIKSMGQEPVDLATDALSFFIFL
ncbi:MAG: hypothetical protein U9N30_08740 [Campylobacterota bacterium]|nr:hypothetical protein [Campylobacterota bacterium]